MLVNYIYNVLSSLLRAFAVVSDHVRKTRVRERPKLSAIPAISLIRVAQWQPYQRKTIDPELVTFIAQYASSDRLTLLDIACGTGSQLVANRPIVPDAWLVGLDRSLGMCKRRSKNPSQKRPDSPVAPE